MKIGRRLRNLNKMQTYQLSQEKNSSEGGRHENNRVLDDFTFLKANKTFRSCTSSHTCCCYSHEKLLKLSWPDHILAVKSGRDECKQASRYPVGQHLLGAHLSNIHHHRCLWLLPATTVQRQDLKTHLLF